MNKITTAFKKQSNERNMFRKLKHIPLIHINIQKEIRSLSDAGKIKKLAIANVVV